MFDLLFTEIALVIITAGVLGLVFLLLRQPLIIAYIVTGLLVGPSVLALTHSAEFFDAMAEIGIAFLLFIVGLHLNWRNIQDVGKAALLAGVGQVTFTSGLGYLIGIALGFDPVTAIIVSVAFAFSSTIIIVKLLTDKEDIDRFYGRISVGVLIVQDLLAMMALLVLSAFRDGGLSIETLLVTSFVKGFAVIVVLWLLAKFILPHLFHYAAKSQELLFLIALSWCFAIASALHLIGFGIEIGALLAGITLAGSPFQREIEFKVRPLRDFFLVMFFIVLGTQLTFDAFSSIIGPALLLSAFILIGNPLIVIVMMRLFGFHPRTGFLVGVTMAQISEFSFIMVGSGIAAGLLDESMLALSTIAGIVTIAVSTYLINYNEQIYEKISFLFRWMETHKPEGGKKRVSVPDTVIFGYENMAQAILPSVKKVAKDYLVVDFDPVKVARLREEGMPVEYGDAGNEEFLSFLNLQKAKLVISTIPDLAVNRDMILYLKAKRSRAPMIMTAKNAEQAAKLYEAGATFVVLPSHLGGELLGEMLQKRKTRKASWGVVARRSRKALRV